MNQEALSGNLQSDNEQVLSGALAAMERAAAMARKIAIQTDTAIVVMENGQIVRRTAAQLQLEMEGGARFTPIEKSLHS